MQSCELLIIFFSIYLCISEIFYFHPLPPLAHRKPDDVIVRPTQNISAGSTSLEKISSLRKEVKVNPSKTAEEKLKELKFYHSDFDSLEGESQ